LNRDKIAVVAFTEEGVESPRLIGVGKRDRALLIPSCVHKGSRWLPDEGDRGEITFLPSPSFSPSPPSLCTTMSRNLVSQRLSLASKKN
jgi:hypothetical protein